jgi:hypothetical protein
MNKLEKHIKEKLEKRELQPSSDAFDRIASQLDVIAPKSYKKWYAVAAVFIGAIVTLSLFLNTPEPMQHDKVVDAQIATEQPITLEKSEVVFEEQQQTEKNKLKEHVIGGKDVDFNNKTPKTNTPEIPKINQNKGTNNSQFAFEENADKTIKLYDSTKIKNEAIDTKIEAVLAQVNAMEENAINVTDAEIDSLLMVAQRELLADKVLQQQGGVDALALLNEAEDELDRTFRGQLFEKLKDGFFKMRTAVADRNN